MKNKTTMWIVIIVVVAILLYFFWYKPKYQTISREDFLNKLAAADVKITGSTTPVEVVATWYNSANDSLYFSAKIAGVSKGVANMSDDEIQLAWKELQKMS